MYGCLPQMPFFESLVTCSLSIASNRPVVFSTVTSVFIVHAHFSVHITGRGFLLLLLNRLSFSAAFTGFTSSSPKQQAEQASWCDSVAATCAALSRCSAGEAKDSGSRATAKAALSPGVTPGCCPCWSLTELRLRQLLIPTRLCRQQRALDVRVASTCLQTQLGFENLLFLFQLCHEKITATFPYLSHYSPWEFTA